MLQLSAKCSGEEKCGSDQLKCRFEGTYPNCQMPTGRMGGTYKSSYKFSQLLITFLQVTPIAAGLCPGRFFCCANFVYFFRRLCLAVFSPTNKIILFNFSPYAFFSAINNYSLVGYLIGTGRFWPK